MIQNLQKIAEIVYAETGVVYDDSNLEVLGDKVRDFVREYRFMNSHDFLKNLQNDVNMRNRLIGVSCSKMTKFFRNLTQLEYCASKKILSNENLRILSAGCSTGQEVYSAAMFLKKSGINSNFKVTGFDISQQAIDTSKCGVYSGLQMTTVPAEYEIYFEKFGQRRKVKEEIKKYTDFFLANIQKPLPEEYKNVFDVIFCRNVFIYFDEEGIKKSLSNLCDVLKPGGVLFLGNSEKIHGKAEGFTEINEEDFCYYKKN